MKILVRLLGLASVVSFALLGCSSDDTSSAGGGGGTPDATADTGVSNGGDAGGGGGICLGTDGGPCGVSGDDAGAGDGGSKIGQACTAGDDCGSGAACGFLIANGCQATGVCVALNTSGAHCNLYEPACACDGTIVGIACTDFPDGYASTPVVYPTTQTCVDGGDARSSDASTD